LTRALNLIGCFLVVALLAGCTTFVAVSPAKKHEIGNVFRVQPSTLWSAKKDGNVENWTINGFDLEIVSFITKVTEGKAIAPKLQGDDAPTFQADMNATDVVNLYEAVLTARKFSQVEVRNLRPHTISGKDGFRFEYSGFDANGLAKRGMVVGLIDSENGLNLVIYEAAAEHYYDASREAAENVFDSLEKI